MVTVVLPQQLCPRPAGLRACTAGRAPSLHPGARAQLQEQYEGMLRDIEFDDVVMVHCAPQPQDVIFRNELHDLVADKKLRLTEVHTDTDGNVTPESQLFDDLVRAILTHPEY